MPRIYLLVLMPSADFSRLEIFCRRVASLPVLPTTALQLIQTIDSGEASAAELERIIVNDPSLSAEILRLGTSSQLGKQGTELSSIRSGIIRMGQRSVRALATSLLVRDLVRSDSSAVLDKAQFARHSLAVGLLAKYLFARRKMAGEMKTQWSADEMFAAGLLSDLGYVLMARMFPDTYKRLRAFAEMNNTSLDDTFAAAFERPASALGAAAAETWGLPEVFVVSLTHVHAPWQCVEECTALSCLHMAGALAKDFGLGMETWEFDVKVPAQISFEVELPDEEQGHLKSALMDQLELFCEGLGTAQPLAA